MKMSPQHFENKLSTSDNVKNDKNKTENNLDSQTENTQNESLWGNCLLSKYNHETNPKKVKC